MVQEVEVYARLLSRVSGSDGQFSLAERHVQALADSYPLGFHMVNAAHGRGRRVVAHVDNHVIAVGLSIFTDFDHLNREMFTVFDQDFHGH